MVALQPQLQFCTLYICKQNCKKLDSAEVIVGQTVIHPWRSMGVAIKSEVSSQ